MGIGKSKWQVMSGMLVIVLMLIGVLGCGLIQTDPLKVGDRAPDFIFPTIDGHTVQLNHLRGQPVLLNFWATWCYWCEVEMPHLQAAFEEKGEEVKFIAVNLRESLGTVRQFAEERGLNFTIALDLEGKSEDLYNIRPIPHTVLIDEMGIIRHIKIGAFRNKGEIIALLDSLWAWSRL